jgi:hypothetical protein
MAGWLRRAGAATLILDEEIPDSAWSVLSKVAAAAGFQVLQQD